MGGRRLERRRARRGPRPRRRRIPCRATWRTSSCPSAASASSRRAVSRHSTSPGIATATVLTYPADPAMTTAQNRHMASRPAPPDLPTRAEVLAALSVAIDLGLGQPAEHMLRSALIATRIADRLGLAPSQRDCIYYATLIMWIGCHADSHEYARWFGDDIAVRRGSYLVDWSGLPYQRFLLANVGRGESLLSRLKTAGDAVCQCARPYFAAHPLALHVGGAAGRTDRAVGAMCRPRCGSRSNASTAAACLPVRRARRSRSRCASPSWPTWSRCISASTASRARWRWRAAGGAGSSIPRWSTRSSPTRRGCWRCRRRETCGPRRCSTHPTAPPGWTGRRWTLCCWRSATSSTSNARSPLGIRGRWPSSPPTRLSTAGLDHDAVALTRRAAWVHDIGRIGVSNQIWSKSGGLTMAEFERMRLHPYLSERILSRVPGLKDVAARGRQSSRMP